MSYKTEFQSNNADLQSIIDSIDALGGSGAKNYNKCSVTLVGDGVYIAKYSYIKVTTSGVKATTVTPSSVSSVTLNDVLCGSLVSFTADSAVATSNTSGSCTRLVYNGGLSSMIVQAPTTAGGTGTATLLD